MQHSRWLIPLIKVETGVGCGANVARLPHIFPVQLTAESNKDFFFIILHTKKDFFSVSLCTLFVLAAVF